MPDDHRPLRRAFVLLELLIVLALLAGVAAVAWPTVSGLLAKSELQSAAKQVRAALAKARLDAMESEAVRQFRYQPGTGRFEVGPALSPAGEEPTGGLSAAEDRASGGPVEEALPSAVRFAEPGYGEDPTDAAALAALAAAPGDADWSAPLLFFPSGRTSNAKIQLRGRRDYVIHLSLRGVTGAVTISKVEQPEEGP